MMTQYQVLLYLAPAIIALIAAAVVTLLICLED